MLEKLKIKWIPNRLSGWILLFVIAAAPFPFGSTNRTAIAFWCILLSVALILLSLRDVRKQQLWIIGGVLVIVAGYAFVLHEQLSGHPFVAPFHPVWKVASDTLGIPISPSASIVKNEPFFALGAPLANLISLLLGLVIGFNHDQARRIVLVIAWSGAAYALYGILSFLIEPAMLLWRERRSYLGSVTGTFINRNTAATYFGSCCVLWLLILLQIIRRRAGRPEDFWKKLFLNVSQIPPREVVPPVSAFLLCLTAMFLAQSRAGIALSLLAMIVASAIFLRRQLPLKTGVVIYLCVASAFALGLLQFLGSRVSSRFDAQGLVDSGRIQAWRSTLRIIADHPLFGTGMGTFAWSFPPYRSPDISMWGVWDLAHSTPLELAAEVGIPLAGAICAAWLLILSILTRGVFTRKRHTLAPLAALAIATLALAHSTIDFTLQAPGYAIPLFALVGAGLAQSFRTRAPGKQQIN